MGALWTGQKIQCRLCERSEAIHNRFLFEDWTGLLRCARKDGKKNVSCTKMGTRILLIICLLLINNMCTHAFQISRNFSIDTLSSGAVQCEESTPLYGSNDICRGVLILQPTFNYTPSEGNTFSGTLGFASGNGLNTITPFFLQPWNADLENVVRHINGRNRSFILTAWYEHEFTLNDGNFVKTTTGIIDSTNYLSTNVYATDEYSQFMSGPLIFGQNFIVPSYDYGSVLQIKYGSFLLTNVYMNVGKTTDTTINFNFYATQLLWHAQTFLGKGNYRFMIDTTDKKFTADNGNRNVADRTVMVSFDQEFGPYLGGWFRSGWQSREIIATFSLIYSGGIDIKGTVWNREQDNIGIGFAYLTGGDFSIKDGYIFEAYYRYVINSYLALSPDFQYQVNRYQDAPSLKGTVFGLRATANL